MANDEKVLVTFVWTNLDIDHTAKGVELILSAARGVNNDVFEMYLDGTVIKEDSPFEIYQLNPCTSGRFERFVQLTPKTYQFIFRVTYSDNQCEIDVSEDHFQTILATGRTINYIELEQRKDGMKTKNDFADISEDSPLMSSQKQKTESKNGCGCGPNKCCLL